MNMEQEKLIEFGMFLTGNDRATIEVHLSNFEQSQRTDKLAQFQEKKEDEFFLEIEKIDGTEIIKV